MKNITPVLLKGNSIEGITIIDICDYPEIDILSLKEFRGWLKDCAEDDIFAYIMPAGTDGEWEELEAEYGIRK